MKSTKILFVCTGNVFRSMIAEYCLKKYCELNNITNLEIESAGVTGNEAQNIVFEVKDELSKLGIDCSKHRHRKVNNLLIENSDLIVSMGKNHQSFLKEKFNCRSPLFYEICYNKSKTVTDNNEVLDNSDGFVSEMYDREMVINIWRDIPFFVKNYKKYLK